MMYTLVKDDEEIRIVTVLVDVIQYSNYEEVFARIKNSISDYNNMIVLDLTRVKFMDSLSLGMLVPLLLFTRRVGGELAIVAPNPKIQQLFEMLRLNKIIKTYKTKEEAVEALREVFNSDGDIPAD